MGVERPDQLLERRRRFGQPQPQEGGADPLVVRCFSRLVTGDLDCQLDNSVVPTGDRCFQLGDLLSVRATSRTVSAKAAVRRTGTAAGSTHGQRGRRIGHQPLGFWHRHRFGGGARAGGTCTRRSARLALVAIQSHLRPKYGWRLGIWGLGGWGLRWGAID